MGQRRMRSATVWALAWLLVAGSGCESEEPFVVQEGEVGQRDGVVVAPGGTLVHLGTSAEDSLPLTESNALVGIYRDGRAYLYHPSQGIVTLSDESSRAAVGRWIAGLDARGRETETTTSALSTMLPGQPLRSTTGVTITRDAQLPALTAENTARRWAAVMPDPTGAGTVYLLPRGSALPTNVIGALLSALDPQLTATNVRDGIYFGESVEVLGAMGRLMPLLPALAITQPEGLQSIPTNPSPQMAVFENLNLLDFTHLMVEGTRILSSALVPECLEPLLKSEAYQAAYRALLAGLATQDPEAARGVYLEETVELHNSLVTCIAQAAATACTGPIGFLVGEIIATLLDIVSLVNWIVDDGIHAIYQELMGLSVYEKLVPGDADGECCFVKCADGTNSAGTALQLTTAHCGLVAPQYCPASRPTYFGTTQCPDCAAQFCYDKWEANTNG